jgi:Ca-activated chloride channel family protein
MRALWIALAIATTGLSTAAEAQNFAIRLRAELSAEAQAEGALPMVGERVRVDIDGQHATTTYRQVFRNQTGSVLEGRYTLRTDLGARVTGFAYYNGEERVVGEVLERAAAREVYTDVTSVRRDPAILEQTADGEFTFDVFPINPSEDKRIEITFSQWLRRREGVATYRIPVGAPDSAVEIVIADARVRDVRSPTHELDMEVLRTGGVRVRTRRALDFRGELVLRYRLEETPWNISTYVHRDAGNPAFFVLSIAAPEGLDESVAPKDVTIVLDRSGSMSGDAIVHARQSALDIIQRLGPEDRLNIIAFDDDVDPLFAAPRLADRGTRTTASEFVSGLAPAGGTDLAFALRRAVEAQHADVSAGRPRVVVFLTDGQSAPEPVLSFAESNRTDVRVFTVGMGDGVNRALLSRLAAEKRGTFTFIQHASQIEEEVGHLYAQIARPLLVGVSLEVDGAVVSRTYPRTLPDLFADDELTISGRLRGDGPVRFTIHGRVGDRPVVLHASADLPARAERPWVGRRWAMSRVDDLLEEIQLKGEEPEIREEVLSLALAYDFTTPYTAFLAIPERELTSSAAQTLQRARDQRADAQARHADAPAVNAHPAVAQAPMANSPGSYGGDSSGASEVSLDAIAPSADYSHAGCASCAVAERRPAPWIAMSLVAIVFFVRRWRSS